MTRKGISLQTRFTLLFLILVAVIGLLTIYSSRKQSLSALRDSLEKMAAIMASQIDGDAVQKLQKGEEKSADFLKIRDRLLVMEKTSPDIKYVYTFKWHDSKVVEYIVDAEWGLADDAVGLGEVYPETTDAMRQGLSKPSSEPAFSTDAWGTFLSGYAPIKNSKGEAVAAVGIDMLESTVRSKQSVLGMPSYAVIMVVVLLAAGLIAFLSMTIIRDIKKMIFAANEISRGNMNVTIDVKRSDEIGELAESFSRMAASLKIMMMNDETDPGGKRGRKG